MGGIFRSLGCLAFLELRVFFKRKLPKFGGVWPTTNDPPILGRFVRPRPQGHQTSLSTSCAFGSVKAKVESSAWRWWKNVFSRNGGVFSTGEMAGEWCWMMLKCIHVSLYCPNHLLPIPQISLTSSWIWVNEKIFHQWPTWITWNKTMVIDFPFLTVTSFCGCHFHHPKEWLEDSPRICFNPS